jgi:uncharacterized membrane protein YedE/YeeE
MKLLTALISGLIFGIGLIVSGMADPSRVIGFLDLTGNWNPSLALVMGGAIPVTFIAFRWLESRGKTALNDELHLPGTTHINTELVLGSLLFGAGWAIAGFCPGPAIVALGAGYEQAAIFVIAMLVGMKIHDFAHQFRNKKGA